MSNLDGPRPHKASVFDRVLQRAVQEAPKFLVTHRALIHALIRLDRRGEARAAAARLLEIRPDYRVAPVSTIHFSPAFEEERRLERGTWEGERPRGN
jgi:hypothetical protein